MGSDPPDNPLNVPSLAPPRLSSKSQKTAAPSSTPPPRSVGQAQAQPVAPMAGPGVGGAVFEDDDDFLSEGGAGIRLELDTAPAPLARASSQGRSGSALSDASSATFSGPSGQTQGPGLAHTSPTHGGAPRPGARPREPYGPRDPDASPADLEAHAFADYGPAPRSWWGAPLYVYRVLSRKAELARLLQARKAEADKTAANEEEALVAFAERVRPVAKKERGYDAVLEIVARAESVLHDRDQKLGRAMDAHGSRLAAVDERIAPVEAQIAEAKSQERIAEEELAQIEAQRQRAESKLKRTDIEARNATARAQEGKRSGGSA